MLDAADRPLCESHDLAMLDLDGVVYVGGVAVPGAAEHLADARERGLRTAFITNNASRPAARVAAHLRELGVEADEEDVVTSAQAAARLLRDRLGEGAVVGVLGGEGLWEAVAAAGLRAVAVDDTDDDTDDLQAVVTGYGPDVLWRDVMRAAVRIRDGLWWVASNTDQSIPTPYGTAPGHGVLVDTLRRFTGVDPEVAGKPERPLLDETIRRVGGERPLMVGDRLDTDIEGARRLGIDSLLVLTGVTDAAVLAAARPEERPTFLHPDLGGLLEPHPAPQPDGDGWTCGGWRADVTDGRAAVQPTDDGPGEPADWWRALAAALWHHLDEVGDAADVDGLEVPRPAASGR